MSLFGFIPKIKNNLTASPKLQPKTTHELLKSSLKETSDAHQKQDTLQPPTKNFFKPLVAPKRNDVDFRALLKLIDTIHLQLTHDEKFGILIQNEYRTQQTIQKLLQDKNQLETFRKIILDDEPATLAPVLEKLSAKIIYLQSSLLNHNHSLQQKN